MMMADNDLLKHVTALLTILILGCAAQENLNSDTQLVKRSADRFWKRDTGKSIESFWKRAVDEALADHELMDTDDEAEKRRVQFLGKRDDEIEEGDEYLGSDDLDELEKRARVAFLGKRGRQAFLGKRADRVAFLGKRGRQAFLGKRENGNDLDEVNAYLDELNEEKRGRQAFLGKRANRPAFLGKRLGMDVNAYQQPYKGYKRYSYLGKRPRVAFLGKRADDEKRARVAFLGKRSVDDQPEVSE